jgi:hypothetical protein
MMDDGKWMMERKPIGMAMPRMSFFVESLNLMPFRPLGEGWGEGLYP